MENIRHLLHLVGDDFIAIGSDFDGWISSLPRGMRDVSDLPKLTDRMLHEGIPIDSIRKILGGRASGDPGDLRYRAGAGTARADGERVTRAKGANPDRGVDDLGRKTTETVRLGR